MVFVSIRRERAQAMAEYGLVLGLVSVISIAGLLIFGGTVQHLLSTLSATVALNV
jgi:Flp pilus assembly pilin Flp